MTTPASETNGSLSLNRRVEKLEEYTMDQEVHLAQLTEKMTHIDSQLTGISQDIKTLRETVQEMRDVAAPIFAEIKRYEDTKRTIRKASIGTLIGTIGAGLLAATWYGIKFLIGL